ncbi:MAG: hypothetical protein ABSE84_07835 [Isosphaeraceae bacterium]
MSKLKRRGRTTRFSQKDRPEGVIATRPSSVGSRAGGRTLRLDTGWAAAGPGSSPMVELHLRENVMENSRREHDEVLPSHQQQLDRLRYHARLAERQFNQSEPDNQLVTAEMPRW